MRPSSTSISAAPKMALLDVSKLHDHVAGEHHCEWNIF